MLVASNAEPEAIEVAAEHVCPVRRACPDRSMDKGDARCVGDVLACRAGVESGRTQPFDRVSIARVVRKLVNCHHSEGMSASNVV
jgi:hypothetical protein